MSTCRTCRNWDAIGSRARGLCRYAPPRSQIVLVGSDDLELKAIWPTTASDDRCGAWSGSRLPSRTSRRPVPGGLMHPFGERAHGTPSGMEK